MRRIAHLGAIGPTAALALVAHLWMFPSLGAPSAPLHTDVAASAVAAIDTSPPATCASGVTACVAAPAEAPRWLLAVAASALPALLVAARGRTSVTGPRARSAAHGPGPPSSPVGQRVLLLE